MPTWVSFHEFYSRLLCSGRLEVTNHNKLELLQRVLRQVVNLQARPILSVEFTGSLGQSQSFQLAGHSLCTFTCIGLTLSRPCHQPVTPFAYEHLDQMC